MLLKQSTAQTVVIGPILDADGVAVTTAIVTNISIAKNGSAAPLTTEDLTHLANGYYTLALTTTNTNTLGILAVFANNTAMSMTVFRWNVIVAQVYDSLVSGTDLLQVDIQQLENSAQNAARILIGSNNNHEVQVTGSNHVAADIHELQPGVITAADFAANAINANALASDAVAEIQSGLATTSQLTTVEGKVDAIDNFVDTEVAAIKAKTDNLPSDPADASDIVAAFTEIKGAGWSNSTDTLEKIRDASGGSNITITPLSATVEDRVNETTIRVFLGENITIGPIAVFDSTGAAVDLSATCEIVISRKYRGDILIIPNGSITRSGVNNNQFAFSSTGATLIPGTHSWALRRVSDNFVFAHGDWIVKQTATKDT